MKKIFATIVVSLILLVSLYIAFPVALSAADTAGTGSATDPYAITDAEGLIALSSMVASGHDQSGKYYRLDADIDISDDIWMPIGTDAQHAFKGNFDGNGHSVSGLYTSDPDANYIGLFGYVFNGSIKNLTLEADIIYGKSYVGGIAGMVNNSVIKNCTVSALLISGHDRVGGVAGMVNVSSIGLEMCSFSGEVYGVGSGTAFDNIGGVVGYLSSSRISRCYAEGMVNGRDSVGGVVGHISGSATMSTVEHCYYTGQVEGRNRIGGVVGDINTPNENSNVLVNCCYMTGWVLGSINVGGIAGYLYNGNITNCAALNLSTEATGANPGRILGGKNNGTIANNIAFSGMIYDDLKGTAGNPFPNDEILNGKDISATEIITDGTIGGLFTSSAWVTENGKLPTFVEPESLAAYDWLEPKPLTSDMFNSIPDTVYTASEQKPAVTAVSSLITFEVVGYYENINAGTGHITVKGTGNYGGQTVLSFAINKSEPKYTVPENLTATHGNTLSDVVLPENWTWNDTGTTSVGNIGLRAFDATFALPDTDNFNSVTMTLYINVQKCAVPMPVINTGLVFDNATKTGINMPASAGYHMVSGGITSATEQGIYSATFQLENDNYIWSDGSETDITLSWTIGAAHGTASVEMESFVYGDTPNMPSLSGVTGDWATTIYEYSAYSDFSVILTDIPKGTGTYYVRAVLSDSPGHNFADLTTDSVSYKINKKSLTDLEVTEIDKVTYNGFAHTPIPIIGSLSCDTDYELNFKNNTNAGTALITINGIGNYEGTLQISFVILPKQILSSMFYPVSETIYTGSEQRPDVSAISPQMTFTITGYSSNIGAGTGYVIVRGTDNYSGEVTISFKIGKSEPLYNAPENLTAIYGDTLSDVILPENWTWNDPVSTSVGVFGIREFFATFTLPDTDNFKPATIILCINVQKQIVQIPTVNTGLIYDGTDKSGINTSFSAGYSMVSGGIVSATSKGFYAATFKLTDGNFIWADGSTNNVTLSWTIGAAHGTASVEMDSFVYGDTPNIPSLSGVTGDWETTVYEYSITADFTSILYFIPQNAGTYYVRAALSNSPDFNFADLTTDAISYEISKKSITDFVVSEINNVIYNGLAYTSVPVIGDLTYGTDYSVSYANNINVGTATITLNGTGNYAGVIKVTFTILPKEITVTPDIGQSKIHGENDDVFTYTVTGLVENDTLTGTLARKNGENAGEYEILRGTLNHPNYEIICTGNVSYIILKSDQNMPKLIIESHTQTSITVKAVEGAEYRIGNGEWTDSNTFSGLSSDTEYTVQIRLKADDNHNVSESASAHLMTDKDALLVNQSPETGNMWWLWFIIGVLAGIILAHILWYYVINNKKIRRRA